VTGVQTCALPIYVTEENIYLMQGFLYEVLQREIKKVLGGFPFTIGVVLGYLVLKHRETKNIVSLCYAKSFGLRKEEITSLLS
jgi:V/A-type H+-transporting ATPase subunit C